MKKISEIQKEQGKWAGINFPDAKPYQCLLGAGEELGELFHAHLKAEQEIRGMDSKRSRALKIDAIGDIVIYLMHYCSMNNWSIHEIVDKTWSEVKGRDWVEDPDGINLKG
jgi:NTP pyrophosphatase (non-canonical NTP hydrolase)